MNWHERYKEPKVGDKVLLTNYIGDTFESVGLQSGQIVTLLEKRNENPDPKLSTWRVAVPGQDWRKVSIYRGEFEVVR